MKIREVTTSDPDRLSAASFFRAVGSFWDLTNIDILDMFARNGELTVTQYAGTPRNLDLWELSQAHLPALRKFSPREVKIGCSYQSLAACVKRYDLIVIDTPQGVHSDWQSRPRYEHFGVLQGLAPLLKDRTLLVVYVNLCPYDREEQGSHGYDEYAEYDFAAWMSARRGFYQCTDPRRLTAEEALSAYRRAAAELHCGLGQIVMIPCHSDVPGIAPYAMRLCLELLRES